ncbi:PorV/PorQ family protein [Candidatus Margulisiibacteriota bacterium]
MRKKLILIILAGLLAAPVLAQGQAGTDIAVLKAGVGARPLGMGSAFTAIADNADAPYWNPGALGFVDHNEITTMQTKLSTDADHYYVSYVRPAWGGTLGISWIQVGLGSITETSSEVDPNNEVVDLSVFSYFSNAYLVSYGKKINDNLSFGLNAKYLTSDMFQIEGGQASGYSITPGLLYKFGKGWSLGLKVDEMLNSQQWGTGTVEQVPAKLRLGLAYAKSNPGLFAIDVSQTLRSGYVPEASLGYEWSREGLSFRVGYAGSGLTTGAGFVSDHTRVDYAYVTQQDLSRDNVHRISLSGIW